LKDPCKRVARQRNVRRFSRIEGNSKKLRPSSAGFPPKVWSPETRLIRQWDMTRLVRFLEDGRADRERAANRVARLAVTLGVGDDRDY
jgi:hypothetical protein